MYRPFGYRGTSTQLASAEVFATTVIAGTVVTTLSMAAVLPALIKRYTPVEYNCWIHCEATAVELVDKRVVLSELR